MNHSLIMVKCSHGAMLRLHEHMHPTKCKWPPLREESAFEPNSFSATLKMSRPTCLKKFEGSAARRGDAMHATS
jgi:hypothetical protein